MKLFSIQKSGIRAFGFYSDSALRNDKGIALVMVLILSLISLVTMAGLIHMLVSGTQVSGIEKRYRTAFEAGKSGRDIAYQIASFRGDTAALEIDLEANGIPFANTNPACLTNKLNNATVNWGACDYSLSIIPGTTSTYDMTFQLGTNPTYAVYAKIVDTTEGNSSGDEGLIKTGVVASNTGEVAVMNIAYLYTIEIDAENINNPAERARLSVLYQY